jgi:hypothetical protein
MPHTERDMAVHLVRRSEGRLHSLFDAILMKGERKKERKREREKERERRKREEKERDRRKREREQELNSSETSCDKI